jgi:hypothetical protein
MASTLVTLFALWQLTVLFAGGMIMYYWRWPGTVLAIGLLYATGYVDWLINADSIRHNFCTLKENGFGTAKIVFYHVIEPIEAWGPTVLLFDSVPGELDWSRFLLPMTWLKIAVGLALIDIVFHAVHKYVLHGTEFGSSVHLFHHCSTKATYLTNFCFSPLDLVLEFALPGTVASIYCTLIDDFTVFFALTTALSCWYGMDHNEVLNFPHVAHHSSTAAYYFAYLPFKGARGDDGVLRRLSASKRTE